MNRPLRFLLYKPIVMLCDVCLVNAAFVVALELYEGSSLLPPINVALNVNRALLVSIAALLTFHLLDLYRDWLRRSLRHVLYSILIAVSMIVLITMGIGFWDRQYAFPRTVLVLAALIQAVLLCLYRMQMRRMYRCWFGDRRTVVIAESEEDAWSVVQKFVEHDVGLYRLQGYLLRSDLEAPYPELDSAETIVLGQSLHQKEDIILHCFNSKKEVLVVPKLSELTLFGAEAREVDDLLVLGIQPHRLNAVEAFLKRMFDFVASIALLLALTPLLLVVSVAIRLTSRGPIFYRQERIGKGGQVFEVLKFRTMIENAERHSGPVLASEHDPRVTEVGRLLRALRIDELPQLINVIRGEMSLVGPRPERPYFVENFEVAFPAYQLRHAVKPGITGLAQVMGRYRTTAESKLNFDLLYIYNYSLLLDLKIVLQTLRVVLQGEPVARGKTIERRIPLTLDRLRKIEEIVEPGSSQTD